MRTADQIRQQVRSGACRNAEANTELLLDIRHMTALMLQELKQIQVNTRKVGRPRKKKAAAGAAGK